MKKRIVCLLLSVIMLAAALMPVCSAAGLTMREYRAKYNEFISKPEYKDGAYWSSGQTPRMSNWMSYGCCAYAADFAYFVYGSREPRSKNVYSGSAQQIKAGDILHIAWNWGEHWVVVLERNGNVLYTAEGSYANYAKVSKSAYWISGDSLKHYQATYVTITDAYHFDIDYSGELRDPVTLTFSTGEGSAIPAATYERGTKVDLSKFTPTAKCKKFTGWYSDKNLSNKITSVTLSENKTVYAGFEVSHNYVKTTVRTATVNETGIYKYICDGCGDMYTVETPAVDIDRDGIHALFYDVSDTAWYAKDVILSYKNGILYGMGRNFFAPAASMNRAMLVTVLYRISGSPYVEKGGNFDDVEEGSWYEDAVKWARDKGIVYGTGGNNFSPLTAVSREQFAVILYRYAKDEVRTDTVDLDSFADSEYISEYALGGMKWAVYKGYVTGSLDEGVLTLMPGSYTTRAQAASILIRFLGL